MTAPVTLSELHERLGDLVHDTSHYYRDGKRISRSTVEPLLDDLVIYEPVRPVRTIAVPDNQFTRDLADVWQAQNDAHDALWDRYTKGQIDAAGYRAGYAVIYGEKQ